MGLGLGFHIHAPTLGFVVITTIDSVQENLGGVCRAGFRFNRDGSIDEFGPGATDINQIHAGEWWSREPDTTIGDGYEVRCASIIAGTWTFEAAAVGTFIVMSADRGWRVVVPAKDAPSNKTVTGAVFEIKKTGGSVLDSSTNSASATN